MANLSDQVEQFGVQGLFDPITKIIALNLNISGKIQTTEGIDHGMATTMDLLGDSSKDLFSVGGSFHFDFKESNEADIMANGTFLHELVHWWQYSTSSLGFFYSSNRFFQIYDLMNQLGGEARNFFDDLLGLQKIELPLLQNAKNNLKPKWKSYDLVSFFLNNPSLIKNHISSLDDICFLLSQKIKSSNNSIINLMEGGVFGTGPTFKETNMDYSSFISSVEGYGLLHMCEAQATIIQNQYLNHFIPGNDQRKVLEQSESLALFRSFLKWAHLEMPDTFYTKEVFAFLIACDIALNPELQYASFTVKEIEDVYPVLRLKKIAQAITNAPEFLEFSWAQWNLATEKANRLNRYFAVQIGLCKKLGWAPPLLVTKNMHKKMLDLKLGKFKDRPGLSIPFNVFFICFELLFYAKSQLKSTLFCDFFEKKPLKDQLSYAHFPMFIYDSAVEGVKHNVLLKKLKIDIPGANLRGDYFHVLQAIDISKNLLLRNSDFSFDITWYGSWNVQKSEGEKFVLGQRSHTQQKAKEIVYNWLAELGFDISEVLAKI